MRHVKYPRSNTIEQSGYPKTPTLQSLDYGEIAINYADGLETISLKNSGNDIVKFTPNTNVFVKNFLSAITTNDVCSVLSIENVYNYQNYEISFLEAYDGNLDLSDIIEYIKDTFYDICDINLVLNVIKTNDTNGAHTSFYINTESMQDLIDDVSKPISNKSSIIGFTKYDEYFIASDSTSMSGLEINWDHTTKAVTVRYSYMNNVYRMNGEEVIVTAPYFYVEDASGTRSTNVLTIKKRDASAPDVTVYYSTDQSNWNLMGTTNTTGITANIPANGRLYLKATSTGWSKVQTPSSTPNCNFISCSNNFNVGGNIMSLLAGDNFTSVTSLTSYNNNTLQGLFFGGDTSKLISAELLSLPATTLVDACYNSMFYLCHSLTTAPVLPATTLGDWCYENMFMGCTSLTTAPALPATTLANGCYHHMFGGCSSLTTAPVLPATTMVYWCYNSMFANCSALRITPALPATTLGECCYGAMFLGCTSLTTPPTLPATTLVIWCYENMFMGCTSLTTAPALPARTTPQACYQGMFQNCTSLTTAPELPATSLDYGCYRSMFQGCTSLTTAPTLPATTLAQYCYYSMFNGCTSLNSVTTHANMISPNKCLTNWLNNVSSSGDFYNLGTATYERSENGIPSGWTEHTSL